MGGNRKASQLPLLKNLDEYKEKKQKVKIIFAECAESLKRLLPKKGLGV